MYLLLFICSMTHHRSRGYSVSLVTRIKRACQQCNTSILSSSRLLPAPLASLASRTSII